jgi:ABC-2 type transport system ATP-binding protein
MDIHMDTIIEVKKMHCLFGDIRAVDGLTFEVQPGEVFGLLGPNGAGKTTTVRLLNGLLPPTSGSIRVFGLDPATQGEQVRQKTGVLTESPSHYERLSARENLTFYGTLTEIPEGSLTGRVDEMLAFFELETRADDKVETFSKGMKQRLALARALLHQPPLLFLDEPTSGLDPEATQQVNALIESLSHKGQTIILCTHNLTEAERLCDRVAVMNTGRVLALGSLVELSRKLWPTTWVDVKFWEAPSVSQLKAAENFSGVKQVEAESASLSARLETKEAIPAYVRHLVESGLSILSVNPRAHSLEDIYFAIQNGRKEGEQ